MVSKFGYPAAIETLRINGIKFCGNCKNPLTPEPCTVEFSKLEVQEIIIDNCHCYDKMEKETFS